MAFQKITESESLYDNLDQMSVRELLEGINNEDRKVADRRWPGDPEDREAGNPYRRADAERRQALLYRGGYEWSLGCLGRLRDSSHVRYAEYLGDRFDRRR